MFLRRIIFLTSNLSRRNTEFYDRVKKHEKQFKLHQKLRDLDKQKVNEWVNTQGKKQLTDKIVDSTGSDFDVRRFIKQFNQQHEGKINLLDFTNYSTRFNDLKQKQLSKQDFQLIRQFQMRKKDIQLHKLNKISVKRTNRGKKKVGIDYVGDVRASKPSLSTSSIKFSRKIIRRRDRKQNRQGCFKINDQFVMLLINRSTTTKVTTLNRINYFKTLVFMGNGNGLISYGKSKELTVDKSLQQAIKDCKRNIIAIPLDKRCTLPRPIQTKFQDYKVYLRPLPGFNSYGHPVFSTMLALSGIHHAGFKTDHRNKNNYTMLSSFFKLVTQNTTPQQMSELQGFKVYRHRFIRPLTEEQTHRHSY